MEYDWNGRAQEKAPPPPIIIIPKKRGGLSGVVGGKEVLFY